MMESQTKSIVTLPSMKDPQLAHANFDALRAKIFELSKTMCTEYYKYGLLHTVMPPLLFARFVESSGILPLTLLRKASRTTRQDYSVLVH